MIARNKFFNIDDSTTDTESNFLSDSSTNRKSLEPLYLYNAVILDTETTGIKHYDEICEIVLNI